VVIANKRAQAFAAIEKLDGTPPAPGAATISWMRAACS